MRVYIDYTDGQYSISPVPINPIDDRPCAHIEDSVYDAWLAHLAQGRVFIALFQALEDLQNND